MRTLCGALTSNLRPPHIDIDMTKISRSLRLNPLTVSAEPKKLVSTIPWSVARFSAIFLNANILNSWENNPDG
jgi:hypothetical protein